MQGFFLIWVLKIGNPGVLGWLCGVRIQHCHCSCSGWSLAWELPHAMSATIKNEQWKTFKEELQIYHVAVMCPKPSAEGLSHRCNSDTLLTPNTCFFFFCFFFCLFFVFVICFCHTACRSYQAREGPCARAVTQATAVTRPILNPLSHQGIPPIHIFTAFPRH